ncbi:MAG: glycosyltransferase [Bacteroidales bacterium]|nr:glycosyltransferase [Bacteroidales bacterium]
MKVLHVINTIEAGGAERLVAELAIQNHKLGVDTYVYILKKTKINFFLDTFLSNNVNYTFSKRNSFYDVRHIFDIAKFIRNNKIDIIHAHLSFSLYYVALAKYLFFLPVKLITTEHSTNNNRRKLIVFKLLDTFIYKRYDLIIAITEDTKIKLNNWVNATKFNSVTIINGINIKNFQNSVPIALRDELKLTPDKKLLLNVGRFREAKNQKLLFESLTYLPEEYILVLIGTGSLLDEYKQYVNDLLISDRVFFLGAKSNVEQYYKSSDLFILPSKWEGFGLVAVEAMAAGIPILVSNVPGLSDVVGNGGFLFESENVHDLVQKILFINNNPEEVKKRKYAASLRVMDFSIETMAEKYLEQYNHILSR